MRILSVFWYWCTWICWWGFFRDNAPFNTLFLSCKTVISNQKKSYDTPIPSKDGVFTPSHLTKEWVCPTFVPCHPISRDFQHVSTRSIFSSSTVKKPSLFYLLHGVSIKTTKKSLIRSFNRYSRNCKTYVADAAAGGVSHHGASTLMFKDVLSYSRKCTKIHQDETELGFQDVGTYTKQFLESHQQASNGWTKASTWKYHIPEVNSDCKRLS